MEIMGIHLPTLNASLNALAGVFLVLGWRAIKTGKRDTHKKFMICAFVVSTFFLVSYITYHYRVHGVVTRYEGTGVLRYIYFTILITHILLAALTPPFAITALVHAIKGNFQKHKQVVKWLFPVWMYVSVTGVVVYIMLYL